MTTTTTRPWQGKDFWAGITYVSIGGVALILGRRYGIGGPAHMQPGFFPVILAGLLIVLGVASLVRAWRVQGETVRPPTLRAPLFITLSIVVFAILLERAGFVAATAALLLCAALAGRDSRPDALTIAVGVGLLLFCVGLFVYGLGIPLPLFG